MNNSAYLLSSTNHVEVPFITVRIGDYTFGNFATNKTSKYQKSFKVSYPNYMESINITKVNGAINTYTLTMVYAITENDDPNLLEKVFSSVSKTRTIYLKYGDCTMPEFLYREEQALITSLTTRVDVKSSKITYVLNCTSESTSLKAGCYNFPAKVAKPSSELRRLLSNNQYGLQDIFTGMKNLSVVELNNFIVGDDIEVELEAKLSVNILQYISYLVSCMVHPSDAGKKVKKSCYMWSSYDDINNDFGGTYFKVVRVQADVPVLQLHNAYEVDVGYPNASNVLDFSINNEDSWSILYDYASKTQLPEYSYSINNSGVIVRDNAPMITTSRKTNEVSEETINWWSLMTQFPITATLTLKGLLRPAMLLSYVKVNTYFYGHKHTSSGLYIITKQEDTINRSGYVTKLTLLRVGGDTDYV